MEKVIIHPSFTAQAQWHALVNDAEKACVLELGEEIESYLVFLLMRFAGRADLGSSILALEFLQSLHSSGEVRIEKLKELGDKCLLFSGLFPEQAKRRHVTRNYFTDMGQSAYSLIHDREGGWAELYGALSEAFINMTTVLNVMRGHNNGHVLI